MGILMDNILKIYEEEAKTEREEFDNNIAKIDDKIINSAKNRYKEIIIHFVRSSDTTKRKMDINSNEYDYYLNMSNLTKVIEWIRNHYKDEEFIISERGTDMIISWEEALKNRLK